MSNGSSRWNSSQDIQDNLFDSSSLHWQLNNSNTSCSCSQYNESSHSRNFDSESSAESYPRKLTHVSPDRQSDPAKRKNMQFISVYWIDTCHHPESSQLESGWQRMADDHSTRIRVVNPGSSPSYPSRHKWIHRHPQDRPQKVSDSMCRYWSGKKEAKLYEHAWHDFWSNHIKHDHQRVNGVNLPS